MKIRTEKARCFNIKVAGITARIECRYDVTYDKCTDYLTDSSPDFTVCVSDEDIKHERKLEKDRRIRKGELKLRWCWKRCTLSRRYAEGFVVQKKLADELLTYGTILIHGAAVARDGRGYIFLGKSGTGKTTHIKNWLKVFPDAVVVNGDKPFVNVNDLLVYGSPWSGKENLNTNMSVPLSALVILCRDEKNSIERISFKEMIPYLMQQVYIPENTELAVMPFELLGKLNEIPCYRLKCNMDEESALVAYEGMKA